MSNYVTAIPCIHMRFVCNSPCEVSKYYSILLQPVSLYLYALAPYHAQVTCAGFINSDLPGLPVSYHQPQGKPLRYSDTSVTASIVVILPP